MLLDALKLKRDKDINRAAAVMAPLPNDPKAVSKMARKIEKRIALQPDEMLVMVDSGSFTHALDAENEEAARGLEIIPPTPEDAEHEKGEAAGGAILRRLGSM